MKINYNKTALLCCFLSLLLQVLPLSAQQKNSGGQTAKSMACFTENKGQVSDQYFHPRPDVLFSGTDGKLVYHLKTSGISYQLSRVDSWQKAAPIKQLGRAGNRGEQLNPEKMTMYRLDISWLNCNPAPVIEKGESLQGYENYYLESCPQGALGVKSYEQVTYKNIYNGIHLKWYQKNGHLKYDYLVSAGADYRQIAWELKGAQDISVNKTGNLVIKTPLGNLVEEAPLVLQEGKRLAASWLVNGNQISFAVSGADAAKPLVIDPLVRLWGTYYGGSLNEYYAYNCVDGANNVFITGATTSISNIATVGSYQLVYGGGPPPNQGFTGDGFIAKFDAQGVRQWATYYGGSGSDISVGCATDASGNLYIVGATSSTNAGVFATPSCFQATYAGGNSDGFIVKFNAAGVRQWGTYYGDTLSDAASGVSIDPNGDPFICGGSQGPGGNTALATQGAFQPQLSPNVAGPYPFSDAYLAKFTAAGARVWSTYYGGSGDDSGYYCQADNSGNVYITGITSTTVSASIASGGCHQPAIGGFLDGFLAKFSGSGSRIWSTYYGGELDDNVANCNLDNFNHVYLSGSTASQSNIATQGSNQPAYASGRDIFLIKFDTAGVRQWGSYYGGIGTEDWGFCSADSKGNVFLTGVSATNSGTAIATPCSYQPNYGGGAFDAFVAKFDSTGTRLWGTYYGGAGNEDYQGSSATIAIDGLNNIYLGCITTSLSNAQVMAGNGGYQPNYGGGPSDIVLVKFDGCLPVAPPPTADLIVCSGNTATLTTATSTCGTNWYNSLNGTNLLSSGVFYTGVINSDTTFYVEDLSCGAGAPRVPVTLTVMPSPNIGLSASSTTVCAGQSVTLTASGSTVYSWTVTPSTGNSVVVEPVSDTLYSVAGSAPNGCTRTVTVAIVANACVGFKVNSASNSLLLYPNPNAGAFTVYSDKAMRLELVNALGQTVKSLSIPANTNQRIEVNELANGVYFIKGTESNGNAQLLQKIVVSKN